MTITTEQVEQLQEREARAVLVPLSEQHEAAHILLRDGGPVGACGKHVFDSSIALVEIPNPAHKVCYSCWRNIFAAGERDRPKAGHGTATTTGDWAFKT